MSNPGSFATPLPPTMLVQADRNLRDAVRRRAECADGLAAAKTRVAYLRGELVKAERDLEQYSELVAPAHEHVSESFDFYRYAMTAASPESS